VHLPTWALALVVPAIAGAAVVTTFAATDAGTAPAGANTIEISNFAFSPTSLTVTAGTTVTVVNDDGATHTLTAADRSFDTGHLDQGDRATFTPGAPGTYTFFCAIHDYMRGTLEVR